MFSASNCVVFKVAVVVVGSVSRGHLFFSTRVSRQLIAFVCFSRLSKRIQKAL